jgi:D-glycero-beta-D-manno-heptose 1-phosphate adenylyltransferase
MQKLWSEEYKKKRILPEILTTKISELKASGRTIATLNGSFDLMHAGHLQIIYEASQVADILVVALNSDRSIQEYKSPLKPIIPLEYRMQMMAALEFVDYVTWFDEINPIKLLSMIKPDVHVNGSEYGENCIEAACVLANGGKIHIVSLVPGLSTSSILSKICTLSTQGL